MQRWALPSRKRPIVAIGAGGIMRDAHLPAYRACGFDVIGVYDPDLPRADALARDFGIGRVFKSPTEAVAQPDVVFDVAVPPDAIESLLESLPEHSAVLIQKPFGRDLGEATRLLAVCRRRRLTAAVNFQLRFAPGMLALRDLVKRGVLGTITDVDVLVRCRMPWELWPFLAGLPRMELPLHSIHYLDAIRGLVGDPRGVYARTVKHPGSPELASSKSSVILDYGDFVRASLATNHHHDFGDAHHRSELTLEGTDGCAKLRMGVNLDYPRGRSDTLDVVRRGGAWESIPLVGAWFPDAFRGPMCNLQRFIDGEDAMLLSPVEDAFKTMALVEACHSSNDRGGVPIPPTPPA